MTEQQYQEWLNNRDSILQSLLSNIDDLTRRALDYTPHSLQVVGSYLVEHFASLADLHRPENRSLHLGLSTYSFEVFRRNLGLEPRLPQDNPRYEYYGVPVLCLPDGPDVSPFHLVTYTVHRRHAGLLSEVYANQPKQMAETLAVVRETVRSGNNSVSSRPPVFFQPMSEENFTSWLTFLTDRLDAFISSLDEQFRQRFDFSPESLEFVGEFIVARASSTDGLATEDALFCDLYSYIGEVFYRNLGLQFFLPKDEDDSAFGQPSIRNASGLTLSLPQVVIETSRRQDAKLILKTFERIRDNWILSEDANND